MTSPRPGRLKARVRRGSMALIAQGISSVSNLVIGGLVAHLLGAAALGRFSLLFAVLLTLVAWQSAWVGDTLTVLDRTRSEIRLALSNTQWALSAASAVVGFAVALAAGGMGVEGALVFFVLVITWQFREFTRRTFVARLEFARQASFEAVQLIVTVGGIAALSEADAITLTGVLATMAVAAAITSLAALWRLPREEWPGPPSWDVAGLAEVSQYGFWRGAQTAMSYLAQVVIRVLVIGISGAAVMGQIEAARLVVAPLFTLISALANVSLASFADTVKRSAHVGGEPRAVAIACAAICFLDGAGVLLLADPLTALVAGEEMPTDRLAMAGWVSVSLALGLSTPYAALALVLAPSRLVFRIRFTGALVSVGIAAIALAVSDPSLVPAALAGGTAVAGLMLWQAATLRVAARGRGRLGRPIPKS